jgi:hypothetical protein
MGDLLHLYELQALSKDEVERKAIRLSDRAKKMLSGTGANANIGEKPLEKILRHFWPSSPFLLRPAIIYIIMLLMILPAFTGISRLFLDNGNIRPVQSIYLSPTRTSTSGTFHISTGIDGCISFVVPGTKAGRNFRIRIMNHDNNKIVMDHEFTSLDESERGQLLFPMTMMKPGRFRMIITDSTSDSLHIVADYRFKIRE